MIISNAKMINPDKYKKNKFRKLIPTSTSETDKLQQLATIDHGKQSSRPQLVISQQIKRSSSKVGVEGVSQRHKEKHFVFERKLKTISSMNQREEEPVKNSNSSFGLYKLQRQKSQVKQGSKLQSLMNVIEQFRLKAEKISKAECLQQLGSQTKQLQAEQEVQTKIDVLTSRTRLSSSKLLFIYLQRIEMATKKEILEKLMQFY